MKPYDEIFKLLSEAELAARNGKWGTCGTFSKRAMEKAFEKDIQEHDEAQQEQAREQIYGR